MSVLGGKTTGKGWIGLVIGAGLSLVIAGCSLGFDEQESLAQAEQYYESGEYRASLIELKNLLQKNPDNGRARYLLGISLLQLRDGAAAEKELRLAADLGISRERIVEPLGRALLLQGEMETLLSEVQNLPGLTEEENAHIHALRAEALVAEDRLADAEEEIEKAREAGPDGDPRVLLAESRLNVAHGRLETARRLAVRAQSLSARPAEAVEQTGDIDRLRGRLEEAESSYSRIIQEGGGYGGVYLKRALVRIARGDDGGAMQDIEQLKKMAPRAAGPYYAEGLLHFRNGDYDKAQSELEQAISRNKEYMPAILYLGASHLEQGRYESAKNYLNKYLAENPEDRSATRLLGAALIKNGQHEAAINVLRPVYLRDDGDVATLQLLSNAAFALGRSREATEYLEKMVSSAPGSAEARVKLGLALLMEGENSKGVESLESAITLEPKSYSADVALVFNYMKAGEHGKAEKVATALKDRIQENPLPYNLLGLIQADQGEFDKAREFFKQAWEIKTGDPSAGHNLARLAQRSGDLDDAVDWYEKVLQANPDHVETKVALARVDIARGRLQNAAERLERIVEEHDERLSPKLLLAELYLETGRVQEAVATLDDVARRHPGNSRVLAMLGEAQIQNDQANDAISTLTDLTENAPESPEAHLLLAKAYAEAGRLESMRQQIEKALLFDPDYLPARLIRVRLAVLEGEVGQARARIDALKQDRPGDPNVLAMEGWLALRTDRPEEAVEAYRRAVDQVKKREWVLNLARAQASAGDARASRGTLDRWLKAHPKDAVAWYMLGDGYLKDDNDQEARRVFEKLIELVPENIAVLNNLAWLIRTEEPERALRLAEKAAELAPGNSAVLDTLGMVLMARGEEERAVTVLQEAVDGAGAGPDVKYHYALALANTGDSAGATSLLEQILGEEGAFSEQEQARKLLERLQ